MVCGDIDISPYTCVCIQMYKEKTVALLSQCLKEFEVCQGSSLGVVDVKATRRNNSEKLQGFFCQSPGCGEGQRLEALPGAVIPALECWGRNAVVAYGVALPKDPL